MSNVTRSLALFLACAALSSGCTDVVLSEESAAICANGADDDGNGLIDCDDPSCDGAGVCEASSVACANSIDDDDDGLTDCEETACQAGGFCDSAVTDCAVFPQAGCRAGMGCYRRGRGAATVEFRCRSGGIGRQGAVCNLTDIDALLPSDPHPCAVGHGCSAGTSIGACGAYCMSDADCPTGGLCYPLPSVSGFPGICTTPCDPRIAGTCAGGLACFSLHERGDTFDDGGARWACADERFDHGTADVGESCIDGAAPGTSLSEVCRSSTACIVNVGGVGATCRALCDVMTPDCPSAGRCERLYPMGSPSAVGATVFGVCL